MEESKMKRIALVVALLFVLPSCASKAPASLTPAGVIVWQANEVTVGLGTLQHVAIGLNEVQMCEPLPCHPLLSTNNTGIVVDAVTDGLTALKKVPEGWRATGLEAIQRIEARLDAAGKTKLSAYLAAARTVVENLK